MYERHIEYITRQIIEKYKPEKIVLFGSAARGEVDQVHDLDFLVIKKDVPYYGIDRIRELDGLIERTIAVDIFIYRPDELEERLRMGDPFIRMILEEGRVLYG
jgi:predicted nucleotidyltransferase